MKVWPLRFTEVGQEALLFCDEAGVFFRSDESFLTRYARAELSEQDRQFLLEGGHAFMEEGDRHYLGFAARWAKRQFMPGSMDYVILVPTLRCDLACSYCQVSRVNANARGFDWSEETLGATLAFLDRLSTKRIKIEFQGGEPLLRLDLLEHARAFCRKRFVSAEFVVCTNLQNVSDEAWAFLDAPDTYLSTSFDGDVVTHTRQRTYDPARTATFIGNLERAISVVGPEKVSALPTIDPTNGPAPETIIASYARLGIRSIYLRAVNYQGFARKRFGRGDDGCWNQYYDRFIEALLVHNASSDTMMEEYYFTHCLRRIFRGGHHGHVDLRNPNLLGVDYLVVDFDGTLYPTDEARMMTRVGQIDLSIGSVSGGIDGEELATLNAAADNNFHEDCSHCAYQPFCGVDLIDDLSRYDRIDLPKHETAFCRRHTAIFRKAFELIYRNDEAARSSLAAWLDVPAFDPALAPVHA
ncbi:His-Xaa-Ser system radical SAM maturase HxsB [Aquibium sp. LZ166]|uniref:His-Xaa-Ser system radical SAM maturase HxsB n=1 Tax=Aquibium pacificus TaxID=3153579 RepID=A0ABV3SKS7_9HYPH